MRRFIAYLIPFFLTVLVIGVIMAVLLVPLALMQDNPAAILKTFFLGPFGSIRHMGNVVEAATPIMLTGLAITILFRSGLNIRIAGSSPGFANHLGLPLKGIIMRAQIVGGLVAGMAGALEVLGLHARFAWLDLPGYGWTGLVVAILARENPFLLIPSALFLGFVQVGGDLLARNMNIPTEVVGLVTAAIMVGATASVIHNHPTVLRLIRSLRNRDGEQAGVQA
ncbi:ABC transporter permease [Brucella abortus]|uniref:ABC transporter permease n=1 Tax=Brucella abortus TaxID=235 RepID=UPI001366372E|nr:ABC transporter permease [Brucella abortus]MBI1631728.1 ABC transporter permease [Brucella abortus]MBI1634772.1 ABC transporter permease [Brucella abortus]MWC37996.1 ABC transporter permease [Brucella abortus]